jgi:hypothetical protein
MYFELTISINRPPADVFAFLRDKDKYPQEEDSPVLLLEQTTSGLPCVGTCYREVVQMLPFYQGEILSTITRFDPDVYLEEDFRGAWMYGHLAYQFIPEQDGTKLIQCETLHCQGLLRFCEPVIKLLLHRRLRERLENIKTVLEGGYVAAA